MVRIVQTTYSDHITSSKKQRGGIFEMSSTIQKSYRNDIMRVIVPVRVSSINKINNNNNK
jgi:hypothetical protein